MRILVCLLVAVLFSLPSSGMAGSNPTSGPIDQNLQYENFQITDDGFVTGFIVNASNKALRAVRVDVWTTDRGETQIFWRKSLLLGDMPPAGKVLVKEPCKTDPANPARTKIKFKTPNSANYRNQ